MPTFDFTSPDGKAYSVQGPEGATPAQAFQILQSQLGAGASPAPDIGENRASALSALRGVPIVGAYADKAAAALNAAGQPLLETGLSHAPDFSTRLAEDEARLKAGTDAYEQSHPIGTTVGKLALGTASMLPAMAAAPGAFGLSGATLLGRAAAGAASGGAIGGVDAAARGDSPTSGAALGALLGAAGPVAGQVVGKVANSFRAAAPGEAIPSGASIKDAAKEGYDAVRASGVTVKPESVQNLASEIQNDFVGDGFRSYLAPKTFSALDELKNGDAFTTAANRGMGEDHAATVEQIRAKYGDPAANAYDAQMQAKAPAETAAPGGPAPAAAPQQNPLSLLQFIASKGGVAPDAELEAIGLARGHREQIPGRNGFFGVIHNDGANLDRMREAAEEAGYLRGQNGATSTPRDLLDAIDTELRGQKRYPEGQEGFQTKRQASAMSEREQAEYDAHIRGFESDLAGAGHGELGPVVKQRAVKLMADEGMDADTAVEHALHQLEQEDNAAHGAGFPGDHQPAAAPVRPAAAPQAAGAPRVVSFSDLHGLRRVLGKAAQSADGVERAAASRAMSRLDRYLENIPASDVIGGDANKAASMLKEANANYTVAKLAERLQGKVDAAQLQAGSANSGANLENSLRQRLRDLLKSDKLKRGFTQRELIEIQKIVRGTAPANVIRALGNMLGGGGGLGTIISGGAGALAGGPVGAVVAPAAGFALKKLGGKMTEAQIARLDEMIRARAPLSAQAKTVSAALEDVRRARLAKSQTAGAITSRGVLPIANGAFDDQRQRRR